MVEPNDIRRGTSREGRGKEYKDGFGDKNESAGQDHTHAQEVKNAVGDEVCAPVELEQQASPLGPTILPFIEDKD